jgi:hypothetical protein
MSKTKTKERRSWPTTILGAIVAIISFYLAVVNFRPAFLDMLVTITIGAFGILATIIAVQGRPKTLRELIESWLYLP